MDKVKVSWRQVQNNWCVVAEDSGRIVARLSQEPDGTWECVNVGWNDTYFEQFEFYEVQRGREYITGELEHQGYEFVQQ